MNNTELQLQFTLISAMPNYCDAMLALKELKPAYKESDFYKATHYSLEKAYTNFCKMQGFHLINNLSQWTDPELLGEQLTELLANIDASVVTKAFETMVNALDIDGLQGMGVEVLDKMNKFMSAL